MFRLALLILLVGLIFHETILLKLGAGILLLPVIFAGILSVFIFIVVIFALLVATIAIFKD
ncbi:MAG: hypothetical protein KCHDKBKB_00739 [Elusimicrobia bacterium]|nr:hypothetical protein [Elusimicrobiota bacterium]